MVACFGLNRSIIHHLYGRVVESAESLDVVSRVDMLMCEVSKYSSRALPTLFSFLFH